jgi:hypothetical protein
MSLLTLSWSSRPNSIRVRLRVRDRTRVRVHAHIVCARNAANDKARSRQSSPHSRRRPTTTSAFQTSTSDDFG